MVYLTYTEKLVRRLKSIHDLDGEDEAAIHALPLRVQMLRARQDVVREGDRPSRCCILFEGLACWYKITGDGVRQILAFQIAGDIPDLHSVHLNVLDSSLLTISPCTVGFVDHDAIRELARRHPRIASAFWRMTLIDGAVFREWVANVGSRKAYARVAHILCEQVARQDAVGLGKGDGTYFLPLTQGDIAAAVGLSTVHVNRALQWLRRKRLIDLKKSELRVLNWDGLQDAGDFDAEYLFITSARRPGTSG